MKYIYIGKIVNTHGIKGELRILSHFDKKEYAFVPSKTIYIGSEKKAEIIQSFRHHKNFEMITLKGYTNINEVLKYKNQPVFIDRESLELKPDEYVLEELIGLEVYEKKEKLGDCIEIVYNNNNKLLYVRGTKNFYIPINKVYIKKVDLNQKRIEVENAKGLIL